MNNVNYKIRVSELADIALHMVELYALETDLQSDWFLKKLFARIEKQATAVLVAVKKEVAVSKLEVTDNLRDEMVINLSNILKGFRSMRSEAMRENAKKVLAVFERYGTKITRENYSSASTHIESLLRDLSDPELQEPIDSLLDVRDTINELRLRQKAFLAERIAYEKAILGQSSSDSATALKRPLLVLLNKRLVNYLVALEEENTYAHFIKLISQVIDEANGSVTRRNKK